MPYGLAFWNRPELSPIFQTNSLMKYTDPQKMFSRSLRPLAGLLLFFCAALSVYAGFSIQNGLLYDGKGNEFIMRGINYPHAWYPTQTATSIPNIAATGANCVRVVLGSGQQWGPNTPDDVAQLIALCKANKLIAILEVHDCTGFGDAGNFAPLAAPMSTAVDYWLSLQTVLKGQEDFVIINIANEPLGNGVPATKWVGDHSTAITRLRAAGFTHTLMVDGADWGQDWEQIMLTNAATVFASDPLKNTIFSVHMYQVYSVRSVVQNYLSTFVTNHLPIVVGEFGSDHMGLHVDAPSILEISNVLGLGYVGWSWSGNTGGTEALDITLNFNPATLSPWGTMLIKSFDGITSTSQLATVFGDVPRLVVDRRDLTVPLAGQSNDVVVTATRPWTVTDNQPWITVTPTSGLAAGKISVTATANPDIGPRSGVVTITSGVLTRSVAVNQVGTGGPGVCGNAVPITLPFVQNGAGDFCWVTSGTINSVNNWSVQSVEINGVNFSNKFSNVMPPRINGNYYIRYSAGLSFAHLEIAGSGAAVPVAVTGVTLAPSPLSLTVGASSTLIATVTPANATNKGTNWASSNPAIASVNSSGAVTAMAVGSAIITATTLDGGFSATSAVTVRTAGPVAVTGVTVSPTALSIGIGTSTTLAATIAPATATNKVVSWTSSNPAVATVSALGAVTAVAQGAATITATTQDGSFTASSVITVTSIVTPPPLQVTVSPTTASIGIGASTTLTATVLPTNSSNKAVTWTSSNLAVATVTPLGVVTGVAAGTATITVRAVDGGVFTTAAITVTSGGPATPCANPVVRTLPLVQNGAGDFCYAVSGNVGFINSWNMQKIEINGVDFTNKWSSSLPPRINGNYYIHYVATVAWAHLEVNGAP